MIEFEHIPPVDGLKITASDSFPLIELIEWLEESDCSGTELVLPQSMVRQVKQTFPLNSRLASLIQQKNLQIYSSSTTPLPTIILTDTIFHHLLRVGSVGVFVDGSESKTITTLKTEFDHIVDQSTPIELDILDIGTLLDRLEKTVDTETRREFERLLRAAQLENLGALDEISVALIAAAQSGALLNDLGKWAEDVGFASKATFSRRKKKLEEQGVIYTEKVPIEIGRPKQRLKLAEHISAVRIKGDDIGFSSTKSSDELTTASADNNGRNGSAAKSATDENANQGDILAEIEKEILDVINKE